MNFPIKEEIEEPAECYILSTNEQEATAVPSHLEYTKKRMNISNGFIKIKMEQKPTIVDNSDCEVVYLDEDSEMEYTQETSQTHNNLSNNDDDGSIPATTIASRGARASIAQLQKLTELMKDNRKHSDIELRILTDQLNRLGPPFRTTVEWRRTWTLLKCNRKRHRENMRLRRMRDRNDDTDATLSKSSKTCDTNNEDDTSNSNDHFHSKVLKTMNLVLDQQKEQSIQLEKLNKNLERLIDVLTEKVT